MSESPLLLTGDSCIEKTQTGWYLKRYFGVELLVWLSVLAARDVIAEQMNNSKPIDRPGLNCLIKDHEDLQQN